MLATVRGYYDGNQIIIDESERQNFNTGDEVIITILDKITKKQEARSEKRKHILEAGKYVTETGRTAEEIDEYIKELRSDE